MHYQLTTKIGCAVSLGQPAAETAADWLVEGLEALVTRVMVMAAEEEVAIEVSRAAKMAPARAVMARAETRVEGAWVEARGEAVELAAAMVGTVAAAMEEVAPAGEGSAGGWSVVSEVAPGVEVAWGVAAKVGATEAEEGKEWAAEVASVRETWAAASMAPAVLAVELAAATQAEEDWGAAEKAVVGPRVVGLEVGGQTVVGSEACMATARSEAAMAREGATDLQEAASEEAAAGLGVASLAAGWVVECRAAELAGAAVVAAALVELGRAAAETGQGTRAVAAELAMVVALDSAGAAMEAVTEATVGAMAVVGMGRDRLPLSGA